MEPKQEKYFCPHCKQEMEKKTFLIVGSNETGTHIYCYNDECEWEGISWDVRHLENHPINKEQRTLELLENF